MPTGPVLFARYAYPPNALGYCGPDAAAQLLGYAGAPAGERDADGQLRELARQFAGAFPYLELIAAANRIPDPLDPRVVAAYWVGGPLLNRVPQTALAASVAERFRPRVASGTVGRLAEPALAGGVAHHAFHVFAVYPFVGMLRGGRVEAPLAVLDRCRIRWGRVELVTADRAIVRARPLVWDGRRLGYGAPRPETARLARRGLGLAPAVVPGDWVALHWDWVCDRLGPLGVDRLRRASARVLAAVNGADRPAPVAVLG